MQLNIHKTSLFLLSLALWWLYRVINSPFSLFLSPEITKTKNALCHIAEKDSHVGKHTKTLTLNVKKCLLSKSFNISMISHFFFVELQGLF